MNFLFNTNHYFLLGVIVGGLVVGGFFVTAIIRYDLLTQF